MQIEFKADLQDTLWVLAHRLFGPIDHLLMDARVFPLYPPIGRIGIVYRKNTTTTTTTTAAAIYNHDHAQRLEVLGCGVMQPSFLTQAALIHLPLESNHHLTDITTTLAPSTSPSHHHYYATFRPGRLAQVSNDWP